MRTDRTYGMGWLHWFYRWRVPVGGLASLAGIMFGVMTGGIAVVGSVLSGACLIGYVALYFGYSKGRWFNLFTPWMYYLTLALMWTECVAVFFAYAFNPVALIAYAVFGVCNHVYFRHRRYLCYGIGDKSKNVKYYDEED